MYEEDGSLRAAGEGLRGWALVVPKRRKQDERQGGEGEKWGERGLSTEDGRSHSTADAQTSCP